MALGQSFVPDGGGGGGGAPSGPAGGVLSGTYPNPGFAADMATQAELDAVESASIAADAALDTRVDALESAPGGGTGRFWDVTAIPTDAAVDATRTMDFATLGSLTGWTWGNQGPATATLQRKRVYLTASGSSSGTNNRRVYYGPSANQFGSTPWCIQIPVTVYGSLAYNLGGIYIKNTANSKAFSFASIFRNDSGTTFGSFVTRMNNETTGVTNQFTQQGYPKCVMAIGFDGTTFTFWVSPDGQDWKPTAHYSETAASHIGAGGTYIWGLMADTVESNACAAAFNNVVILTQATPVPHGQLV